MFEDRSLTQLFPTAADVPEAARVRPSDSPPVMLIDGKVIQVDSDDLKLPVYSRVATRNGDELSPVLVGYEPTVGTGEALAAIDASHRALAGGSGAWPTASLEARCGAVERFAAMLAAETETIARLLMWEIAKPIASARAEVTRSIEYIKDTVAEAKVLGSSTIYTGTAGKTTHNAKDLLRPLGQVLCVAPFNYPINEFLTTIIPALLAGNVVIAKTPRFGTLANQALARAFAEAFPPGVVALLPGDGRVVLPAVISHKQNDIFGNAKGTIDVLAFIGSE
ncbi:MAG TPA: aldehyde dehydrogenase family protein, partial [Kofleriaceae bacterium]|nr:aldehyde dehydrogenase family protein [Kofleriaceae bacterium]